MKAEERHRLHENELQRLTEHARLRSRPFLERYGTTLLLGLAGVLLVIAAIIWWNGHRNADRGVGWDELGAAFRNPNATAEDFVNVAELYPETKAAAWARLHAGEAYLESGLESLFTDREGAARDLADARENFETVLEADDASSELTVRALYGLAKTLETTSDGDLEPAIEKYRQVVEEHAGTIYEELAQERLTALETSDAKEFYAWFSKQKPSPTDRLQRPNDQGAIPGFPPMTGGGPALGGLGDATAPETTPTEGAPIEAPRPTAAPTAEGEAPATDQPADDVPASDEATPAAEASEPASDPEPQSPQ